MQKMDQKNELEKLNESDSSIERVGDSYLAAATSKNTRQAYQSDINHFLNSGRTLPTTPIYIESYLKECAQTLNPRTIKRRIIALRQYHVLMGLDDPTKAANVVKTMQGIARLHGAPRKQAAAIRLKDLDKMAQHLEQDPSIFNIRNRALILLGYFGAFRRSEISSLSWDEVSFVADGIVIKLMRSKTDQTGQGEDCIIPFGDDHRCPVRALIDWRKASSQLEGPIFRQLSKTGTILKDAICSRHINRIVKQVAKDAMIANADQVSAHSLRRGFATEAARLGASMPAIQKHGRWKSTKTVFEYIEAGRQFKDSAVNVMIGEN